MEKQTKIDFKKITDNMNENSKGDNYEIVMLNIEKTDREWKKSRNYLSSDPKIRKRMEIFKDKYNNSRRDLLELKIKIPPIFICENGIIRIVDGRNRFSNMRDLNAKVIPALIEKEQKSFFIAKGLVVN